MKSLFFVILSLTSLKTFAAETALPCENVAQDVAAYVSKSGWGQASGYIPVTTSRKFEDSVYTFTIEIKNPTTNDRIGDSYEVSMYRDGKSESCVTMSVEAK